MVDKIKIGNFLRQLRTEKGMTQEDLATKSGVSRATISGLESGSITVTTTETLRKIASALEVKVSDLIF